MSILRKTRGIGHCRVCDTLLAVWSRPWQGYRKGLRACAHNDPAPLRKDTLCRGSDKPAQSPYTLRADF